MHIQKNYPLKNLTSLQVGGPSEYFAVIKNESEAQEALKFAQNTKLPVLILGSGSNIVVSDNGFPGLTLLNEIQGMEQGNSADKIHIKCGAGTDWDTLVEYTIKNNLAGLEGLSGIPGKVGGSPVQNINAYGYHASSTIKHVETFDIRSGEQKTFSADQCGFGYRKSIFNTTEKNNYLITRVVFELVPDGKPVLAYEYLNEYLKKRKITNPSIMDVRTAVLELRKSRGHTLDSGGFNTVGSFFKNPDSIDTTLFQNIETTVLRDRDTIPLNCCPDPWHWNVADNKQKVSAACLVHCSGILPGTRMGKVGTSEKQTLAVKNYDNASSHEIMTFTKHIREQVYNKFKVVLEIEPDLIGFTDEELTQYLSV